MLNYTHICHIFKLKSLNGMLKYKVKMFFFTTPLSIHDKKYYLQVYYDKAILLPHIFLFSIKKFFSVYNNVD